MKKQIRWIIACIDIAIGLFFYISAKNEMASSWMLTFRPPYTFYELVVILVKWAGILCIISGIIGIAWEVYHTKFVNIHIQDVDKVSQSGGTNRCEKCGLMLAASCEKCPRCGTYVRKNAERVRRVRTVTDNARTRPQERPMGTLETRGAQERRDGDGHGMMMESKPCFCIRCGTQLAGNEMFCPRCGQKVDRTWGEDNEQNND